MGDLSGGGQPGQIPSSLDPSNPHNFVPGHQEGSALVAIEDGSSSFGAFASLLLLLVVAFVSKLGVDYYTRDSIKKE